MDRRSKEAERRRRILDHAKTNGNAAKTCRYFGVARASFYRWHQEYQKHGDPGLIPKTTGPKSHPNQTPAAVVDQVLHLRRTYHLGPIGSSGTSPVIMTSRLRTQAFIASSSAMA